jgi:hypothetical protein
MVNFCQMGTISRDEIATDGKMKKEVMPIKKDTHCDVLVYQLLSNHPIFKGEKRCRKNFYT